MDSAKEPEMRHRFFVPHGGSQETSALKNIVAIETQFDFIRKMAVANQTPTADDSFSWIPIDEPGRHPEGRPPTHPLFFGTHRATTSSGFFRNRLPAIGPILGDQTVQVLTAGTPDYRPDRSFTADLISNCEAASACDPARARTIGLLPVNLTSNPCSASRASIPRSISLPSTSL